MAIFHSVFDGKISCNCTSSFLDLIARKRREGFIDDIAYAFDEQYKTFKNILPQLLQQQFRFRCCNKTKIAYGDSKKK
jgi:F0F1-type ATP synthase delta subunit